LSYGHAPILFQVRPWRINHVDIVLFIAYQVDNTVSLIAGSQDKMFRVNIG
jgi:hypothetical protein